MPQLIQRTLTIAVMLSALHGCKISGNDARIKDVNEPTTYAL